MKNKFKKILLIIAFTVVGIILAIRTAIPIAGVVIANKILPDLLNADASIGFVNMILVRGRVSAGDLIIQQPDGFEGAPLFSLSKAAININIPSLINGPATIESITIDDLELNIIRNTNGIMNVESLASTSTTNTPTITNEVAETSTSEPPAVVVENIEINNLTFSYKDLTYAPPLITKIENLNLSITNITFDPAQVDSKKMITDLNLTAILNQQDLHDAFIGITTKLSILGTGIPAVDAAVRITGLELDHLDMVVPPGISQTLGGSCVDFYVDLAMATDILDCRAKIKTADNTMRLTIGGTPTKPVVDKSTALGNIVTRPGAIIGGLIGDASGAGLKIIGGAGKTTAAVGGGALKVVGGLGKGLFRTAKGVATADMDHIKGGLYDSTVGTASKTKETVVDTTSTASSSIGDIASTAIGKTGTDAWRAGCEERWNKLWIEAQKKVNSAPYPHPKNTTNSDEASLVDQLKTDHTEGTPAKRKSKKKNQRYH